MKREAYGRCKGKQILLDMKRRKGQTEIKAEITSKRCDCTHFSVDAVFNYMPEGNII